MVEKKAIAVVLCVVFGLVLSAGCDSLGLGGGGGEGGGAADGTCSIAISDGTSGGYGNEPSSADVCTTIDVILFKGSDFSFATVIPDDDPGLPAGGWQESKVSLTMTMVRLRPPWVVTCDAYIGMPLRAKTWGKISAQKAGDISASVANYAAKKMREEAPLPGGIFCTKFKKLMDEGFMTLYVGLGARMQSP